MKKVRFKWIWDVVFYVIIVTFLLGIGLFAFMQTQNRSVNGYRIFGVLTDSMIAPNNTLKEGGFRSGDILVVKEVEPSNLKVGDVVTMRLSSSTNTEDETNYLTHRIIKIDTSDSNNYQITTQGDANRSPDRPTSANDIVGKEVFRIPAVGGWLLFIREHLFLSLIIFIAGLALFWGIKQLFSKDFASDKE